MRDPLPRRFLSVLIVGLAIGTIARGELVDNLPALFARLDANGDGELAGDELHLQGQRLFERLLRNEDTDESGTLSLSEFTAALTPARPAKSLVAKLPAQLPGADAVQWLLLRMDAKPDGLIEQNEVPIELLDAFDQLIERADRNDDDKINRIEIARVGPQLARLASRLARESAVDVTAELEKLRRVQGPLVHRFDEAPNPEKMLADPQTARQLFGQLDANGDGHLTLAELPGPIREGLGRLLRFADRDKSGGLSEREFVRGAQRMTQMRRRRAMDAAP